MGNKTRQLLTLHLILKIMAIWIARNKDGTLEAYRSKPERKYKEFDAEDWLDYLDDDEYPEVTWENSPKELRT